MVNNVKEWRISSFCSGADSSCVGIALPGAAAAVRDTKSPDETGLVFPMESWRDFVRLRTVRQLPA